MSLYKDFVKNYLKEIFVKENRGSMSTCINHMSFFGKPTRALQVYLYI